VSNIQSFRQLQESFLFDFSGSKLQLSVNPWKQVIISLIPKLPFPNIAVTFSVSHLTLWRGQFYATS